MRAAVYRGTAGVHGHARWREQDKIFFLFREGIIETKGHEERIKCPPPEWGRAVAATHRTASGRGAEEGGVRRRERYRAGWRTSIDTPGGRSVSCSRYATPLRF